MAERSLPPAPHCRSCRVEHVDGAPAFGEDHGSRLAGTGGGDRATAPGKAARLAVDLPQRCGRSGRRLLHDGRESDRAGEGSRADLPRPAADGGSQHDPGRCAAVGCEADLRPRDGFDLRPVQHHRRARPVGGDGGAGEVRGDAVSERNAAYHEAGHAVAHWFLDLRVGRVTIVPDEKNGTAGTCRGGNALRRHHDPESAGFHDRHQWRMERDVLVLLAGTEATRILTGRSDHVGASSDYHKAIDLLSYYTPENTEESRLHFKLLRQRVRRLLTLKWSAVQELAEQLLQRKTLSGKQAVAAMAEGMSKEFERLRQERAQNRAQSEA